jgi:twitching motility protein PilT
MNIRELLQVAVQRGASDLHVSAGQPPWLRVDGDLCRLALPPLDEACVLQGLADVMSEAQQQRQRRDLDADFSLALPGLGRFRVATFLQERGAAAVFRHIPDAVPTLAQLGLGAVFQRLADLPRGLVCVTGPTGSGKSTTLAALIDHINTHRQRHILTIEDPIEFVHSSRRSLVSQREVERHARSFAAALRAALREDPDVILIGELRDLETVRLALTAAETGHLVLATLHTASAAKTIDRIIDVFPAEEKAVARSMLAESLQAVVAQTLLKRVGGGRVAAHELMLATPAIRNLVREARVAQLYSVIQTGAQYGMQTLDQALKDLLAQGLVERQAARWLARDADAL